MNHEGRILATRRANKDRNSQRSFLSLSPFSNEAHDTCERHSFLLTRHLLLFRRYLPALSQTTSKKQGPRDQQKAPTLSPVRRLPVRTPVYLPPSRPNSVFSVNQSLFATMKFFESQHEFDYSWEEVSTANWRKYCPWNDKTTHVIAVDTISRHVDPTTGIVSFLSNYFTPTSSD